VRIRFAAEAPAAAARVRAAAKTETFAAGLPFTITLKTSDDCRLDGARLAPLLAGCPSPVSIELGLAPDHAAQFAFGLQLRSARPLDKYRTRPDDDSPLPHPSHVVIVTTDPAAAQADLDRLEPVTRGVLLARDLVTEPGNLLTPEQLTERARLLGALGVTVEVLEPAAHGLNLLAAVGRAGHQPPRLVVLRWPGDGRKAKPLVLVGKGITFDAGGISIKPASGMEEMKGDMAGAAAVLGAIAAIAGRRDPVPVVGVLAVAENMPGSNALRPGDVLRSHKGLTVEVVDTDAEGRLVLADALSWAAANLDPGLMVDAATLTGAVVRVLGRHHAGLYTANGRLARTLMELGRREAEPLWRLPLSPACDEHLKSDIADWKNCGWGALPDNDDAARFLQKFVPPGLAWAHLDIAGTSETPEDGDYAPKGATGFGVRLFAALAEDYLQTL
jgi:leucyl aminopeptidase